METLIILHGWSYSTEKWKPFLKLLERNGIEHEMLKIPGLTAPLGNVWTLDDYISWLHRQTSKIHHPISMLGHSNGGRIAAAFSAKYPDKISSLILIDSAGIIHRDIKTLLKKGFFGTAAKIGKRITNSHLIRDLFYKVVGEQDYLRADPNLKKTMFNLISRDLEQAFSKIKVPTLIIWGENDKITPVSDGKKIHNLVLNSKLEIIKNARHSPQLTHSNQVAKLILQFINNDI